MVKKTVKSTGGTLTISIPSGINEITLGQVMKLQENPVLNDLEVISILSGVPVPDLQNIKNFDDLYIFGEIVLLLSNQLKNLYANDKVPPRITFPLAGGSKTVNVIQNLSVEPAGAFFPSGKLLLKK